MLKQNRAAPPPASDEAGDLPLYEIIHQVLRDHIAAGRFPAGLVLGESAVARAFQSSRIPAAAALRRLKDEGLLRSFDGRGFLIGGDSVAALRLELGAAGLRLPESLRRKLDNRSRKERIYSEIEHQVACCLAHGRFQLNESALASTYGVSRTVAHEVLTRLERSGLIAQGPNRRWYAGPLTQESIEEHYEMRWVLEPIALSQSMDALEPSDLVSRRERITRAKRDRLTSRIVARLEHDLHVETVLKCRNQRLRDAIRRSQLPLIATHETFERYLDDRAMSTLLAEHQDIFDRLIHGDLKGAMAALESHLRRSAAPTVSLLNRFEATSHERRVPYLIQVE